MAEDKADRFPEHWGSPPEIQTMDYRELPGDYGSGSSTLGYWICENMVEDGNAALTDDYPGCIVNEH